jgi:hypothetical protein
MRCILVSGQEGRTVQLFLEARVDHLGSSVPHVSIACNAVQRPRVYFTA